MKFILKSGSIIETTDPHEIERLLMWVKKEPVAQSIPVRVVEEEVKRGRGRPKKEGSKRKRKICIFCGGRLPKHKKFICNKPECIQEGQTQRRERWLRRRLLGVVGKHNPRTRSPAVFQDTPIS